MKTLLILGLLVIIMQAAVLLLLHKRRQRFRQEREKFLAEFDSLQEQRDARPGHE